MLVIIDMCMQCSYRLGREGEGLKVATVSQHTGQGGRDEKTTAFIVKGRVVMEIMCIFADVIINPPAPEGGGYSETWLRAVKAEA